MRDITFSIISAMAKNRVIGIENRLPWHLKDDLKHFKQLTLGHAMLMGRKTFESLPGLLPERKHFVLTRDQTFSSDSDQVEIFHDVDAVIDRMQKPDIDRELMIIGGASIYSLFLPLADQMYLTHVMIGLEGDARFPEFDTADWESELTGQKKADSNNDFDMQFVSYRRIPEKVV